MLFINKLRSRLLHPLTVLLVLTVITTSYLYLDRNIETWISESVIRGNAQALHWITNLADGKVVVFFVLGILWFRYIQVNLVWEERTWFVLFCILLSGAFCLTLKFIFGRARPNLWLQNHEYGFYWLKTKASYWSFPSGHSTTIFSIVFALSFLFPRHWPFLVLTGFAVASTRVLLGYHYFGDVIAAGYLSLLEILFFTYFLRQKGKLSSIL